MKKDLYESFRKVVDALLKKKKKKPFYHDPEHDWLQILGGFVALFIVLGLTCGFFFYKLNKGDLFKVEAESNPMIEVFDKNLLKQNNDFYDAREKKFNELRPLAAKDPVAATTTTTTTQATTTGAIDQE
ncbi:hypothetical protein H0W32_01400 [Patescibacteria group bacterium]|nr:hypothetical protein [Patescibacteria group bacterium]